MPVVATVSPMASGKSNCNPGCATALAFRSPSVITLPARPNGIPSNIGCSVRSAKTGPECRYAHTRRCLTSSALRKPRPAFVSRLISTGATIQKASRCPKTVSPLFASPISTLCPVGTTPWLPECETVFGSILSLLPNIRREAGHSSSRIAIVLIRLSSEANKRVCIQVMSIKQPENLRPFCRGNVDLR
jgi:hypothetical protein